MKKARIITAVLIILSMFAMSACSGGTTGEPAKEPAAPAEQSSPVEQQTAAPESQAPTTAAEFSGKLKSPFVVTTCGQSPGSVMVNMIAMQAGLSSVSDTKLSADTFDPGDANTLIITTGTSGKGMGAAGTDIDEEIARCTALADAARKAGLTIVCAHVEGMARRTDANDQASIDAILAVADVVLVTTDGNGDKYFSDYATEHNLPFIEVKDSLDIAEYME